MFVCFVCMFYVCGWADGAVVQSVVSALHVLYSTERQMAGGLRTCLIYRIYMK